MQSKLNAGNETIPKIEDFGGWISKNNTNNWGF